LNSNTDSGEHTSPQESDTKNSTPIAQSWGRGKRWSTNHNM
jgi:hypothetical protein